MGHWILTIRGTGPHHNDKPFDVDIMLSDFVDELRAAGHHNVRSELTFPSTLDQGINEAGLPTVMESDAAGTTPVPPPQFAGEGQI